MNIAKILRFESTTPSARYLQERYEEKAEEFRNRADAHRQQEEADRESLFNSSRLAWPRLRQIRRKTGAFEASFLHEFQEI